MTSWKRWTGISALLMVSSACHGDCYMTRSVEASGTFGDTLVAVSGFRSTPGSVVFSMIEQLNAETDRRYANVDLNRTNALDTVSLIRMTLVSDPARTPVVSRTVTMPPTQSFTQFAPDTVAFNKLFIHVATEDVLFEIVTKNGSVSKALLNLESRVGPREKCDPYT